MALLFKKCLIAILFVIVFAFASAGFVSAATGDNVSGWAWSSTIGWIGFNGNNYGVHICTGDSDSHAGCGAGADGKMVGYAWSSNIGWIKFDPVGPYPSSPSNAAQVDRSGNVTGWIRACAGAANADCSGGTNSKSGGWDGWIKLYNATVSFALSPAEFHGYAWGSDVIGWVSFNCAEGGASGGNICGQSNYKVITNYSLKPNAINLNIRQTDDYCVAGPSVTTSWTFVGDSQSAYQAQIFEGNFATLIKDSGKVSLSSNSFSTIENIKYGKTYSWQVQVWDSLGRSSGWIKDTKTVATPAYQYPSVKAVGFSWLPVNPAKDEAVQFVNNGKCYNAGGEVGCTWFWQVPSATYVDPSTSASKEPIVKFNGGGVQMPVTLTATDPDGNSCEATRRINVSAKLPKWQEITPF